MAPRIVLVLSLLALAIGCGTPTVAPVDGGSDAYARPDAPPSPDSCDMDHLHVLEGMDNGTVSIEFDTTMTDTRPRDLGLGCGNPAADIRWAAQEVVALHVPGTGPHSVSFTTTSTMTQIDFNTLIQVRTGDCRTIPTAAFPITCFDDNSASDLTTRGGITLAGGSTAYFIVTGYSDPPAGEMSVDEGRVHVDFTIAPNTPPTITMGHVVLSGVNVVGTIEATDAEGPITGYAFTLHTATEILDLNGDGTGNDDDAFFLGFDSVDRMAPNYVGHSFIDGMNEYTFAALCRQYDVTQWGITVFDAGYARSAELLVPVIEAPFVGIGATCDIEHLCPPGLNCTAGACAVTSAATSACAAAGTFALTLPTGTSPTMSYVTGTVGSGMGVFTASCAATPGREQIWHLTIPAGMWDLALSTGVTGTAATADTVLSLRSVCADQSTELMMGCNDDIDYAGRNWRSALSFSNIPPGEYYAFVEAFGGGAATPYTLQATLTPRP